jgi:NitT/TauT family transport system substrate-binding protein
MKMFKAMMLSTTLAVAVSPSVGFAQDTTITVIKPTPRSAVFFPLVVGEALGYFEDEGITVNLLPSDTSIPYVAFVQNGQADLAMLDPNETINAVIAGANINTVYEVMQNAPEGIAVLKGGDYTSMDDLVGTTVGLVSDQLTMFKPLFWAKAVQHWRLQSVTAMCPQFPGLCLTGRLLLPAGSSLIQ